MDAPTTIFEEAREIGALGATISGAGPSVLVWTTWDETGKVMEALHSRCDDWAELQRVTFTNDRADVPEI